MTHHPLCPWKCDCGEVHNEMDCEQCDLITKVHEDALAGAVQRVEAQIRFWFDVAPDGRLHIHPSDVGEYLFRAAVIIAIKGDQE